MKFIRELSLAVKRIDDLRDAESRRVDEQMKLRADYEAKLTLAEAKRIDAIRAVDVNAVSVASDRAATTAALLATQVANSAEALRVLVATTAESAAKQMSETNSQINVRLMALENAQHETKGSGTGMRDMWGWLFGGLMGLVGFSSLLLMLFRR